MGNGWLDPEVEDRVDFRRSQGRRSWLNVPIMAVRDQTFVFRARSELVEVPLTARVHVNGHHLGTMKLSERWEPARNTTTRKLRETRRDGSSAVRRPWVSSRTATHKRLLTKYTISVSQNH